MHNQSTVGKFCFSCMLLSGIALATTVVVFGERRLASPVRSRADDEVKQLPGLEGKIDFKHYSGYLAADLPGTKANSSFLHYWLVESQAAPSKDSLLVWFTGGPGCSSLVGLFSELGPFELVRGHSGDGQAPSVRLRPNSWNQFANVLFVDTPIHAGYSYTKLGDWLLQDDDSTASLNLQALAGFYAKFPELKQNPLYLVGEGYAAVYVATLAKLLIDNKTDGRQSIGASLKGVAFANGYLDQERSYHSLLFLAYHHGLYGKSDWDSYSRACCNSQPPSRGSCRFEVSWTECGNRTVSMIETILYSGVNPYNILRDCNQSPTHNSKVNNSSGRAEQALDAARMESQRPSSLIATTAAAAAAAADGTNRSPTLGLLQCDADQDLVLMDYLDRPDVRSALHVPTSVAQWEPCTVMFYDKQYAIQKDGLMGLINALIGSGRNLNLLIYSGDVDLVNNFLGAEWFADDLGRRVLSEMIPWHLGKQVAGWVKHYEGISFVTIKGAGHMAAQDRPAEVGALIEKFLYPHGRKTMDRDDEDDRYQMLGSA